MENLPTEILLHIFKNLSVNDLVKCRIINWRWQCIIDSMFDKDLFWKNRCEVDFADTYEIAKKKCRNDLKWENLYRSMKLWGRLSEAEEQVMEFCASRCYTEDVKSAQVVANNELAVHQRSGLSYYNLSTLKHSQRKSITGCYIKCTEADTAVLLLNMQLNLMLMNKSDNFLLSNSRNGRARVTTFYNIKDFIVTDDLIYMIHMDDSLHYCYYRTRELTLRTVGLLPEAVVSMGIKDGQLQLLLYDQKIYSVNNDHKLCLHTHLDSNSNLLQKLIEYNLLDTMDWQIYFQWMCEFKLYLEPGSILQDCVIMRIYGDVVFIGTNWGTFRIYYRPFHDGVLDLYRSQHIIEHSFIDQVMTYTLCPILSIDWQEDIDGHNVIVTVPKKIIVLKYKHV